MNPKLVFRITLITTIVVLAYLFWWHWNGVHSGYYQGLYGLILIDKFAFISLFLLAISVIVSLFKLRHDWKYGLFILGAMLFTASWFHLFDSGRKILHLEGCFESVCTDITLRSNGTFRLTTDTQTKSYAFSGAYKTDQSKILLFSNPSFEAFNQEATISQLKKLDCIYVEALDFNLWGGCFKFNDPE